MLTVLFLISGSNQELTNGPHSHWCIFKLFNFTFLVTLHSLAWNPSHLALIFPIPPSPDPPNGILSSLRADDVMEKWNTHSCRISRTFWSLCSSLTAVLCSGNNLIMMMSSCQEANCSRALWCEYQSECPAVNGVERGECSLLSNHNHKTLHGIQCS